MEDIVISFELKELVIVRNIMMSVVMVLFFLSRVMVV